MSGHTKWEDVKAEVLGKKYTTAQWMIHLGDNPWQWMDLTDAKEETTIAGDLQHVYDQMPPGLLLMHPRNPVFDGDYDVRMTVELDDLLN